MCQAPSEEAIRGMLGPVISSEDTIEKIRAVPSLRPQRVYEVVLSDGRTLHLVLPSLSMWRPLRSEQDVVSSEAAAVRWIRDTVSQQQGNTRQQEQHQKENEEPSTPSSNRNHNPTLPPTPLSRLLPALLHQGRESHLPESAFAVYAPVPGTPLTLLPFPPPESAHLAIDHQLGVLFRELAALTSPTGRFGPLSAVINANNSTNNQLPRLKPTPQPLGGEAGNPNPNPNSSMSSRPAATKPLLPKVPMLVEGGLSATGGAGTWSVAFHSMLEGVLRDGEDMAVVVAYSAIRRQFRRLGYVLDELTTAKLVVVNGVGRSGQGRGNVVVEVEEEKDDGREEEGGKDGDSDKSGDRKERETVKEEEDTGKEVQTGDGEKAEDERTTPKKDTPPPQRLRLTGLRDWSSCVFGDPLLAAVFSDPLQQQPPSSAFLEGFNGEKPNPNHKPNPRHPFPLNETVIEGIDTAWIRILLYQVYHAVARIVGEFYRPRQDSSTRELEARRKLNEVLARLAEVPDDVKKSHKRPSGEMSPAKRFRGLGEGS